MLILSVNFPFHGKKNGAEGSFFIVSLDLLLFMNMEVQNFKHMDEESSQRGINGFNHQTKLGKRDGFSYYE